MISLFAKIKEYKFMIKGGSLSKDEQKFIHEAIQGGSLSSNDMNNFFIVKMINSGEWIYINSKKGYVYQILIADDNNECVVYNAIKIH